MTDPLKKIELFKGRHEFYFLLREGVKQAFFADMSGNLVGFWLFFPFDRFYRPMYKNYQSVYRQVP